MTVQDELFDQSAARDLIAGRKLKRSVRFPLRLLPVRAAVGQPTQQRLDEAGQEMDFVKRV